MSMVNKQTGRAQDNTNAPGAATQPKQEARSKLCHPGSPEVGALSFVIIESIIANKIKACPIINR